MFYSRKADNKIKLLHERVLSLFFNDNQLPFEKLLEKDGSFTVHHYRHCALNYIKYIIT